jgi:hypothetical protein
VELAAAVEDAHRLVVGDATCGRVGRMQMDRRRLFLRQESAPSWQSWC